MAGVIDEASADSDPGTLRTGELESMKEGVQPQKASNPTDIFWIGSQVKLGKCGPDVRLKQNNLSGIDSRQFDVRFESTTKNDNKTKPVHVPLQIGYTAIQELAFYFSEIIASNPWN